MIKKINKKFKVIDLFSGSGGLSYGFIKAGYDVVAGMDNWKESLITFEKNHPRSKTIELDLGSIDLVNQFKIINDPIDVVIGGPPCQGFSISGKRDPNDPRNGLFMGFVEAVKKFRPKAFVLENVPNLVSMDKGRIKDQVISELSKLGFNVQYKILLASDYGVPQNRRRVVFIGTKPGLEFEYPKAKFALKKRTCIEALGDLPESSVVDGSINTTKPSSEYQKLMRKNTNRIFNHQTTQHSETTVKVISLVPDGGNYKNLPKHLQSTRKVHIAWTRYNSHKPSFTVDTGHRHHFHYKYNRIPTVRETARLQSFPDSFIFYGSKTSQYKQVGNAVPPLMAEAIAKQLKLSLVKH